MEKPEVFALRDRHVGQQLFSDELKRFFADSLFEGFAALWVAGVGGGAAIFGGQSDPDGADRFGIGASGGTCDAGDRYGNIGSRVAKGALGHGECDRFTDGAVLFEEYFIDA